MLELAPAALPILVVPVTLKTLPLETTMELPEPEAPRMRLPATLNLVPPPITTELLKLAALFPTVNAPALVTVAPLATYSTLPVAPPLPTRRLIVAAEEVPSVQTALLATLTDALDTPLPI